MPRKKKALSGFVTDFFTKKAWKCICGNSTDGRDVPGIDIVLEWSSGDRWPADPAGLCCFSDGKLDYLILAATSVIFSVLQTRIFIWGEAVSPSLYWGFLSDDKTCGEYCGT